MTNEITVTYERKFSDGNYGSEGLSFTVTTHADPEYFADDSFAEIAHGLRRAVLGELAKSEAPRVAGAARRELNPPPAPLAAVPGISAPADPNEDPF